MQISSRTLFWMLGLNVGKGTKVSPRTLRGLRAGDVKVGSGSILGCRISIDRMSASVEIGDRCYVGASHLVAATSITLEDDVIVSWGVTIVDHDSHAQSWRHRSSDVADWARRRKNWSQIASEPVLLKKRCWVGFNATILKGVTVGEGAIVGACAVVTRDVPPNTVVVGNPARVVKELERNDA